MHAKGSGAFGTFRVTGDITPYTKAKIFAEVGVPDVHAIGVTVSAAGPRQVAADAVQGCPWWMANVKLFCYSATLCGGGSPRWGSVSRADRQHSVNSGPRRQTVTIKSSIESYLSTGTLIDC